MKKYYQKAKNFWMSLNLKYKVLLLILLGFLTRIPFMSCSLDDWDSMLFADSLDEFDVEKHQPHPPGYPVYVLFGKIAYFFVDDHLLALNLVSVISGSLSIPIVYLLFKDMFSERIATLSTFLYAINPLNWVIDEKALTDGLASFFVILTMYLLYKGLDSRFYLLLGCFSLGLTIGVRPQFIVFSIMLFFVLFKRKNAMDILISFFLVFLTCISWFLPMLYYTGGFDTYYDAAQSQSDWHNEAITLGPTNFDFGVFLERIVIFFYSNYFGHALAAPGEEIFTRDMAGYEFSDIIFETLPKTIYQTFLLASLLYIIFKAKIWREINKNSTPHQFLFL